MSLYILHDIMLRLTPSIYATKENLIYEYLLNKKISLYVRIV